MANGSGGFSPSGNHLGANLAFTKFLFVTVEDEVRSGARVRSAGASIARGFFNDFDADGTRDVQPCETIQFLLAVEVAPGATGLAAARFAVQVSSKYRPRLDDAEQELRRRLGDGGHVTSIEGAERSPRYSSSELYDYAYRRAQPRQSGRVARRAFVLPLSKTHDWWAKSSLERHTYFYPHVDAGSGCPVSGHARSADAGISTLFRRLYHNPDGYEREGEFDFVTYFECEDEHVATFDRVCASLRDTSKNPEWQFVREGPLWRGARVLRW
ncbi:MAG: hypothetical protein FJW23_13895 [Acidimicrobiia bacterium]|nr:hypothetical protein [Acidimicrobiia bacterium]